MVGPPSGVLLYSGGEMPPANRTDDEPAQQGCLGLLCRVAWLAFGNAILFLLAVLIAQKGAFSVLDIIFAGLVGVLRVRR